MSLAYMKIFPSHIYLYQNSILCNSLVLVFCIFVVSCSKPSKPQRPEGYQTFTIDSLPFTIVKDSDLEQITPGKGGVPLPNKHKLGKPKAFSINSRESNVHSPIRINVTKPKVNRPGSGHYSLPQKIAAVGVQVDVGRPERVVAKDPYVRDKNPQNFASYGKHQGLKQSTVQAMIKDQFGNIWLCTNGGVTKYDGKYFTHYTDKEGLASNLVFTVLEDRDGIIWFGTYAGVSRYDGRYFTNYTTTGGLGNNIIHDILQDKVGNLWFATEGGITQFDGNFFTNYSRENGLPSNLIRTLMEDHIGNIWVGTDGGGLCKFDGSTFDIYSKDNGLSSDNVYKIIEDQNHHLWLATYGGGLNHFDGEYFTHYKVEQGLPNNEVWTVFQDHDGIIWLGLWAGGVVRFDGKTFKHYTIDDGLASESILAIMYDTNDGFWFGSEGGGVMKYEGKLFTHMMKDQGLSHNNIWDIHIDTLGYAWLGSDDKLNKMENDSIYQYSVEQGLSNDIVLSISEDEDNNLLLGTYGGGVDILKGDSITHFKVQNGLSSNYIKVILPDSRGNHWLGTFGGGVMRYDGQSFTHFRKSHGLLSEYIRSITEDQSGNLWLGTYSGISIFDGDRFFSITEDQGMFNSSIWSITTDKNGNIWFGTNGAGLGVIYKPEGGFSLNSYPWKMTLFTEEDGLIGNNVFCVYFDSKGALYVGTRFGLSIMNPTVLDQLLEGKDQSIRIENLFESYTYEDGFLGFGVNGGRTIQEMPNGKVLIGANDRMTIFHPNAFNGDSFPPNPQLIDIEIYNDFIPWKDLISLDKKTSEDISRDTSITLRNGMILHDFKLESISPWYDIPLGLSLAHDNNFVRFQFLGVTQEKPKKVKYQYYLDGLDAGYSAETAATSASYSNLEPGDYTFKFKARNSHGIWSEEYSYPFEIRAPWWQWLSFRIVVGILLLLIFYRLYRYRMSSLRAQKRLLEKLVEEKTEEVQVQNKELKLALQHLKNTQSQLVESDKMASLGVLTAGVAHEINNPLNFIQGGYIGLENHFNGKNPLILDDIQLMLKGIKTGVDRATLIVRSLNQFSRDNDTYDEECDIHVILGDCIAILHSQCADRIEVITVYANEKLIVKGNVGKLHQVFLNLIGNAIHSIENEGTVRLTTKLSSGKVNVEISDNGSGISEENLEKITEPFFTTKDPGKGTGLGLSISYTILKAHNATMVFDSEVGRGTRVVVAFK